MSALVAILIMVFTSAAALLGFWFILKNRKERRKLYYPSIAAVFGMAAVVFKYLFISEGYDGILDVVLLIMLAILLGIFLLTAVSLDVWSRRRKGNSRLL